MILWEDIKELEGELQAYSKRFIETCETLQRQHGWVVSALYQQEIYRIAVSMHNIMQVPIEKDLLCITIEQQSFALGEQAYHRVMAGLQDDQRIYSMKDN